MKKKISQWFKSDLDINGALLNCPLNNTNIHKKSVAYALNTDLSKLNPTEDFNNDFITEKNLNSQNS